MEGPFADRAIRRVRLLAAVAAFVELSVAPFPAAAASSVRFLVVVVPLTLVGVNLLSLWAGERRWSPPLQVVVDCAVALAVVGGMSYEPRASLWVLLALPLAEAALRWGASGPLLTLAGVLPAYVLVWAWAWDRFGADPVDGHSLAFRAVTLLLFGGLAGAMSEQLRGQRDALRDALVVSERRAELLRTVAATGRRLPSEDLPSLLDGVAAAALRLGFDVAELAVVDGSHERRVVAAQRGLPPAATAGARPADDGLVGAVCRRRRTLVIPDYSRWAGADPDVLGVGLREAVGAPVWVSGRVEAVLCAGRRSPRRASADEIECLEMLALQAGAAMEAARRQEDQASYAELLRRQARQDALTGLANRALLIELLRARAVDPDRAGAALLFVDLDRFKHVNDTFGHAGGDQLLRMVAARMGGAIRPPDVLARLGGDEFVVLLDGADELAAVKVAERLHAALEERFTVYTRSVRIRASIGVAVVDDAADPELALARADMAMYAAKGRRHPRTVVHDERLQRRILRRVRIDADLHGVEQRGELRIAYQPLYRADGRAVVGAEALLRWRHPDLGDIPPSEFIRLAELNDAIHAVGWWVLDQACGQLAAWRGSEPSFRVWVNVSPGQLAEPGFAERLEAMLARHGCPGDGLVLELTEAPLRAGQLDAAARTMRRLHARGICLVADDFGQESSSLGRLRQLPFDGIKIDRALLGGVDDSPDQFAVVRSITELAHDLRLEVVAEGVETRPQLEALQRAGCDLLQGFELARPDVPERVSALLAAARRS